MVKAKGINMDKFYICCLRKQFVMCVFLLNVFLMAFFNAKAQQNDVTKLQEKVQNAIAAAQMSSVLITDYDTITAHPYGSRFSGVIVNKEGMILTVAHASNPNAIYQVTCQDGQRFTAKGLGKVAGIGVAMMKINEKGNWHIARLGSSGKIKVNEPCISIAYPASFDNMIPVVRFGYIAEKVNQTQQNRFRTTCLMEPGDSGGPVYDLSGNLIGMNNNIERGLDENYEVPIDLYKKYWNALLQPENYENIPIGESIEEDLSIDVKSDFSDITTFGNSLIEKEKIISNTVIKIESDQGGKKITAQGTLVTVDGLTLIVSKNSIIGENPIFKGDDGKINPLLTSFQDVKNDLVLLTGDGLPESKINMDLITQSKENNSEIGKLLYSPLSDGSGSWSILGTTVFDLESKFRAGYSGIETRESEGTLRVDRIASKTDAENFDFRKDDVIISVDGKKVNTQKEFLSIIRKKMPNDYILITTERANKKNTSKVRLEKLPVFTPDHPASFFQGGRSTIRDGFNNVFVTDSRLSPSECGGPVFDLQGRLMGLNIARYSRVSNIVLSANELDKFIKAAIANNKIQLKSGNTPFAKVNL